MRIKSVLIAALFINVVFAVNICAQGIAVNEKFVISAVQTIHSAQATWMSTSGIGNYGTLAQLRNAGFIDNVLAAGEKYGYRFSLTVMPTTQNSSGNFTVVAVPARYGKSGKRSFYTDWRGVIHAADHNGGPSSANDPVIFIECGEAGVISALRSINSAQSTYFATYGQNATFGTMFELVNIGLVDGYLVTGRKCGYDFTLTTYLPTTTPPMPARYTVTARPVSYQISGVRSFFTDQTGILRGADKGGENATVADPPIEF
jgi:hypothetical protein